MNAEEHLKALEKDGYTVLENVLSKEECASLGEKLDAIYEERGGHTFNYPGCDNQHERLIISPHVRDSRFADLVDHPRVMSVMTKLLDDELILSYFNARDTRPGCPPQPIHIDSRLPFADQTLVGQAIWMLDDFTAGNGATRVVPGSHRSGKKPDKTVTYPDEVQITGKAGSVLIYNSCLWHAGSACSNYTRRWGVITTYSRWFVKPSMDFVRGMPADLYARLRPMQKQIFGFNSVPPINEFERVATITPVASLPERLEDYKIT